MAVPADAPMSATTTELFHVLYALEAEKPYTFIENIEHMVDNANYTSVYPRMSLAPEQRFASKGSAIARFDENDPQKLVAVADWLIPEF